MNIPGAIFMVNSDLNDLIKQILTTQLFIHETITGAEFDARIVVDPNYPGIVKATTTRILVIRENMQDFTNRDKADVVLFISHGLAYILQNGFGPTGLALPIYNLTIYDLLRYNKIIP